MARRYRESSNRVYFADGLVRFITADDTSENRSDRLDELDAEYRHQEIHLKHLRRVIKKAQFRFGNLNQPHDNQEAK